jgi:soluble lytic murein transglycosylase-like protein
VWRGLELDEEGRVLSVTYPRLDMSQEDIETWKEWVGDLNSGLTDEQRELVVRWIIGYSILHRLHHALVFAVLDQESDARPTCGSHAGALGMMQLMPGNVTGHKVGNPYDVQHNIRGGIEILSAYLDLYADKSAYDQCVLGLAAYNAGPNAVKKYQGVPPYAETQKYVREVPARFKRLHDSMP